MIHTHSHTMKYHPIEHSGGSIYPSPNIQKKVFLLVLALTILVIPLCLNDILSPSQLSSPPQLPSTPELSSPENINVSDLKSEELGNSKCSLFNGQWVPYPNETYYTNTTCNWIIDQQNCMKFGRPDLDFLKWRWKPNECELSFFDAAQFLELMRGKSLAFLGDSVGRNQMQSLLCLLSKVTYPVDVSHEYASNTVYFKRYIYPDYNFTLAKLWSPFLVKAIDADPKGHAANSMMKLYLDEADEAWATEVEKFDYVIVSAGQWFFRPLMLYENGTNVGCSNCQQENVTKLATYYGYRKAFQTTFRTLQNLKNYKGVTFLRTFSPSHFENGAWNEGGNCARTKPFSKEEKKLDGYVLEMYLSQVEELRAAEEEGKKRGLEYRLMDTTALMLLRPDGHPNFYGHSPDKRVTIADCVHWCLPGPIDTWNEFLLQMLRTL